MSLFAVMVISNWLILVFVPVSDGLTIQTFIRFVYYFIRISQWNNKPPGITKVPKYKIQDTNQPIQGSTNQKKLISRKNYHRKEAFSLVGTPNYIAPEVLQVNITSYGHTEVRSRFFYHPEKCQNLEKRFLTCDFRLVPSRVVDILNPVIGGQSVLYFSKWSSATLPFMPRRRNKHKKKFLP